MREGWTGNPLLRKTLSVVLNTAREEDYSYTLDKILRSVNLQQIGAALQLVLFASGFFMCGVCSSVLRCAVRFNCADFECRSVNSAVLPLFS